MFQDLNISSEANILQTNFKTNENKLFDAKYVCVCIEVTYFKFTKPNERSLLSSASHRLTKNQQQRACFIYLNN